MNSFKIGDVVMLKAGGLKMTIDKVLVHPNAPPAYECMWFVGSILHVAQITEESFILAPLAPEEVAENIKVNTP